MSWTLLELTRAAHEEIELRERVIVKDLLQKELGTNKKRLYLSHRIRNMVESITATTQRLIKIYEDEDNSRKDEIEALGRNVFDVFYDDGLKHISEYHRKHHHPATPAVADASEEPLIEFSGEESFGKYLDLHELYNMYLCIIDSHIEYSAYLDVFSQPQNIPLKQKQKSSRKYKEYISSLVEYLVYFLQRTEPLQDLDRIFSKVVADFEEERRGMQEKSQSAAIEIDLDYYKTAEELVEVGPERLKQALSALGLKTGGTLEQRAGRLFLTKNTPLDKLDRKHFSRSCQELDNLKVMEGKVRKLCELLEEAIARTKENVVRKQGLTYEEMEEDRESDHEEMYSTGEEEKQHILANNNKLAIGWDGKPIPSWLYKLHGLNLEFKCEICGDYSYRGRRAFERHFKESQHQHGMRRLRIPNTNNFNEITSIKEAQELWKCIQERQGSKEWHPDLEEEYEDTEGNIYSKKIYNDLKRQRLI